MNRFLKSQLFGVILVLASLVALVMAGYSSYITRSYAMCQSQVTEQLIHATTARAAAAEEDRQSDRLESEATALLIKTIFDSTSTAERLAAYDTYKATLRDLETQRASSAADRERNPLPEPPSEACH